MSVQFPTPKRPRPSIRRDRIDARDYNMYPGAFSCEDCSHFNFQTSLCTIGYNSAPHRRETQKKSYDSTGLIAFCRFLEVD